MALKGSITNYFYIAKGTTQGTISRTTDKSKAHYSLTLDWEVLSQDSVTNQSTIKWALKATAINFAAVNSSYSYNYNFTTLSRIIFGTDAPNYGDINPSGGYYPYTDLLIKSGSETIVKQANLNKYFYSDDTDEVIAEGTSNVTHDVNGHYNFTLTATLRIRNCYDASGNHLWHDNGAMDAGQYSAHSVSGTVNIDSIVRRASIKSAPLNFTDEDSPTIVYSVPPGLTGYIYLSLDGAATTETTHLQAVTGDGTHNYSFTEADLKKLWAIQDNGLKTQRVKFFIKTIGATDGSVPTSGTDWLNFEIINFNPEFDEPEVYDTNQDCIDRLTGNKYTLVRYVSNAYFDTGAKGNKGATITSQSVRNGDITLDGPTGTFEKIQTNEFHFTATDNYGRTVQETMQFTKLTGFIDYVKLTCNVKITEMTAEGVATVRIYGKFFDGNFGNVKNKQNRLRVNYDLYTNGSDDFDHVDLGYADLELGRNASWSVNNKDYEYTFEIDGLDYQSYYNIQVRVSDEVSVQGVAAQTLLAATPIFDWGRRDFNFNVPVTIQGWEVDRVVDESYEESGYYEDANGIPQNGGFEWSFRKWSSGLMECWCSLPITTNVSSAWGSMYASGRLIKTNILFPREFVEVPVVTATLSAGYAGGILMPTGGSSIPTSKYAAGTLEIVRGTSLTNASYTINYMVKGRWK
jgi:hypothetical protein